VAKSFVIYRGQIMHKPIVVAASLLFVVASAFAQQSSRSNAISVFVTDMSAGSSGSRAKFDTAYGASFEHMFSSRFSAEVSVTSQRSRLLVRGSGSGSSPTFDVVSNRIYPIDANVSYHFLTDSRWKPYAGAGLRYVRDTFHGPGLMFENFKPITTVDPEVSGGLVFQFNRTLGVRFDAKQVIGSNRSTVADPEFKVSVGLSVRF
jgi:outer membrane protein W